MDTIFALASGQGRSGVAVIRLSGPASWLAVAGLAGTLPAPRRASLRRLRAGGLDLDDALVLLFAEGESFTGEESAELQVHGSVAVVSAVQAALSAMDGLRPAEAGEFTRRALENGRLDLAQVEGLADLIDAETETQRRQALRVLSGAVGARAEGWRRDLIDFADEDVPADVTPEVRQLLSGVMTSLRAELAGYGAAERIRDGFEVAIVGRPNTGKSTLLNALAGREAAITSEHAGTTRDVIEVRMDLGGLAVTFLDTAGMREAQDPVEAIGIARARDRAEAADLRIFLLDQGVGTLVAPRPGDILAVGKCDIDRRSAADADLRLSGLTGEGISALTAMVAARLGERVAGAAVITRERHRLAIRRAVEGLERAIGALDLGLYQAEVAAEEMRHAIRGLDSLVGRVDVENLLDEIFASFCIGK
ncbi:MAG: tRNA uridine-5-carboxymethylaminomethyl(34) synthesis GTPase MnmE [Alphaproteobacteria bacterium HGW-Alphaproteobacteria-6]|nr:MAG: tRNA uridine-5-carboxymethylaminomethyl(34) synthesis GTPase MnmE [Alphaproteobacteria bacterium HGW-Alphaproteobacteria-6]